MNRIRRGRKKGGAPLLEARELRLEDDLAQNLTEDLTKNHALIQDIFRNCSDFVCHEIVSADGRKMLTLYIEGLVNTELLTQHVIKPLQQTPLPKRHAAADDSITSLQESVLPNSSVKVVKDLTTLTQNVLSGHAAVLVEGRAEGLVVCLQGWKPRSIEDPQGESYIRGPREGFTEEIRTNAILIRRKLQTNRLKVESFTIGELSNTKVELLYIEGIASETILAEVRRRLSRIQIDGIFESGYIEELIEDSPYTPFPQIQNTERPDVTAANLLEGKVAILVDGTPFVLLLPYTFWSGLQSGEDYYERFMISTLIRWVRYLFLFIALLFPSLYVAVTTFHQEMIPTNLLLSISEAREASPFPALVEALIMEITFEALREAGVRLPKQVGSAISIVGALVIGQAAVQAGIVSAPMVIIVSLTAIASFTIPRFNFAVSIRILRFPLILLAGTLGLYGITIGLICMLIHLNSLRSFGVPYLYPVAPFSMRDLKDVLVRAPIWKMTLRPHSTAPENDTRMPSGQMPSPDRGTKPDRKE